MKEKKIKIMFLPIICMALLTAIDQFTKFVIKSNFDLYESREVIKNTFAITYIRNKGAAWGVMQGQRIFFLILTSIIIIGSFYILYNIIDNHKYIMLTITLIVLNSGAIGNMIDRAKYGYVVDFLDFKLINFPIFNVADIYVTCSMFVLFILLIFVYKEEDMNEIIGKKTVIAENSENTEDTDNKESND